MRIVNPSFGEEAPSNEQVAANSVDWSKDPIILFSNSKPNAKELLEGMRSKMSAYRNTDNIDGMYDELAGKYRAAILAIAD